MFMRQSITFISVWLAGAGLVQAVNPALPIIPTNIFKVTDYGAIGDGIKDNTTNVQNTINAANTAGGGIVEIPAGTFLSGPITLKSSINLQLDSGAVLRMLPFGQYPGSPTAAPTFILRRTILFPGRV
jgi:polygalacturonase